MRQRYKACRGTRPVRAHCVVSLLQHICSCTEMVYRPQRRHVNTWVLQSDYKCYCGCSLATSHVFTAWVGWHGAMLECIAALRAIHVQWQAWAADAWASNGGATSLAQACATVATVLPARPPDASPACRLLSRSMLCTLPAILIHRSSLADDPDASMNLSMAEAT